MSNDHTTSATVEEIVRRRAAQAGQTVDEILSSDVEYVRALRLPTPDCLDPAEVEKIFSGALEAKRLAHADHCALCATMVSMARPTNKQIDEFINTVVKPAPHSVQRGALIDAGAYVIPAIILGVAATIFARSDAVFESLLLSRMPSFSITVFVSVVLLILATVAGSRIAASMNGGEAFTNHGGSILGGIAAGLLFFFFVSKTMEIGPEYAAVIFERDQIMQALAAGNKSLIGSRTLKTKSDGQVTQVFYGPPNRGGYGEFLGSIYKGKVELDAFGTPVVQSANRTIKLDVSRGFTPTAGESIYAWVPKGRNEVVNVFVSDKMRQPKLDGDIHWRGKSPDTGGSTGTGDLPQ